MTRFIRSIFGTKTFDDASRRLTVLLLVTFTLFMTACPKNGPKTVVRDRFDYNTAISDSMKDQMLMNIVKLRYLDYPVFVDVSSIINSYEFQASASLSAELATPGSNLLDGAVAGTYSNRPTITYTPLTSNQYVRGLLTPLPPELVFFTVDAGYRADIILLTTVSSINGLHNDTSGDEGFGSGDPAFFRVAEILRDLQRTGAIALFVKVKPDKTRVPVLQFVTENQPQKIASEVAEIKELLKVDPSEKEFQLTFGTTRTSEKTEITLQTRSLIQILGSLAARVDVPAGDDSLGVSLKGLPAPSASQPSQQLFHVTVSDRRPARAFITVRYRDHWFSIDDADLRSKRVFAVLLLLFSFGDNKGGENLPILTIPVN